MTSEEGYGEEGYTVMGMDHYTAEERHIRSWQVMSFFIGGVVGAGIALLLTPQAGSRTRQQLKDASRDAKEKAEVYYKQVRDKVEEAVSRGTELVSESKPLLTAAIEAGKEAYEREKERRTNDPR
jgi:gas vesicle protein